MTQQQAAISIPSILVHKLKEVSFISVLKFTILFFVMLGFGGVVYLFSTKLIDLITLSLIALLLLADKSVYIKRKLLVSMISVVGFLCLHSFVTHSPIGEIVGIIGRIISMSLLILAFKHDYTEIRSYLIRVLDVIVKLAVINSILYIIVPFLFVSLTSESGFPINTIGFVFNYQSVFTIGGIHIPRNQGLFWEPGVLQIPVNLYIYYRTIVENKSLTSVSSAIYVLFTTVSTTGFLIFAVILFYKFKSLFSLKGKGLFRTLGMVLLIGAFIPFLYEQLDSKFNKPGENISSMARTYDLIMAAKIAIDNPWLGIGINPDRQYLLMEHQDFNIEGFETEIRGNTNSILQLFVNFGVPVTLFLLLAIYKQQLFPLRMKFMIIISLSFFSEPLVGVSFMILLMLSSINFKTP